MGEIFGAKDHMRCPYCNREMKMGYIKSSHAICWGTEKEPGVVKDDLCLTKPTWRGISKGLFAESYDCEACGILIVPLDQKG